MTDLRTRLRAFAAARFAAARAELNFQPAVRIAIDAAEAFALGAVDDFCDWLEAEGKSMTTKTTDHTLTWYDHLLALLTDVVNGRAGQAGRIEIGSPDVRQRVRLAATGSTIVLTNEGEDRTFTKAQAPEALSAFVAAVEGGA